LVSNHLRNQPTKKTKKQKRNRRTKKKEQKEQKKEHMTEHTNQKRKQKQLQKNAPLIGSLGSPRTSEGGAIIPPCPTLTISVGLYR
jgi:hypothetical protein